MVDYLYGNGLGISSVPFLDCARDNVVMCLIWP
jgi:hypothetical protein